MISALALARAIEAGTLTPAAALERCAAAIAEQEPAIKAFAHLALDGARAAAARARGPLAGIAVGVKDIIDTADMPTAMGSPIWAGWRPKADAPVVAALRGAGAAIVGKTTTTPFAHMHPTATENPRAPGHTPGGSSSGSAAAVASGMAALALGTQTGGSVIRPASFCGVAAIKPSFRLVPTVGVKCFSWALDTVGLFGAGVADIAFGLAAITGRPDLVLPEVAASPPRFLLTRQDFAGEAAPEAIAALDTARRALETAGAAVADARLPPVLAEAFAVHAVIQDYEAVRALGWEWANARDALPQVLADQLAAAEAITPAAYDSARRVAKQARGALRDTLPQGVFLLTYAAPGAAPATLASTGSAHFNRLWTLMGVPCVAVPGPTDGHGRPVGVQVIGRFGSDAATLRAAALVEAAIAAMR